MNSHNLNFEPLIPRIFRVPSQEEEVFPCQVSAFDNSSHESADVQKKKENFFFLTVREAYFTLLFHSEKKTKNGGFMFKMKEQTCRKRLYLETCFLNFEAKGSDGQVKYVL